jgi:phenylacetate-CoA ligase
MMHGAAEAGVLERLERLRALLVERNPFYGPRLAAVGFDRPLRSVEEFTRRMPFTLKTELAADQERHPPYGSNLTFPLRAYTRLHQTSSTTGAPLRWLDTPESWSFMLDGWQVVLEAAGVTAEDRVLVAFGFGPFIGLWMAFDAAARLGCLAIPGGAMTSTQRLRLIEAHRVTALCCTPTYALRLGEVAEEEGLRAAVACVRRIVVGGEPGGSIPATRARLERLWPEARFFDHYGMTEVGPVTFQCPDAPQRVHVLEEQVLCEIVDPGSGAPMVPGAEAMGELVLTPLGRPGSPVLRYRTGDLVRAEPRSPCACGRTTLTLAGGILGRADDMVFIRGVNLYPGAVDQVIRSHGGVAEYRVEISAVRGMSELRVLVEPDAAADPSALCRGLERAFRDAYNLRIAVADAPRGTLPRFDLKARRWIRVSGGEGA